MYLLTAANPATFSLFAKKMESGILFWVEFRFEVCQEGLNDKNTSSLAQEVRLQRDLLVPSNLVLHQPLLIKFSIYNLITTCSFLLAMPSPCRFLLSTSYSPWHLLLSLSQLYLSLATSYFATSCPCYMREAAPSCYLSSFYLPLLLLA